MKVLLVFELIPEETNFYIIDMSQEEYDALYKADGYVVNADEFDEERVDIVNYVQNNICPTEEYKQYCSTEEERKTFGSWSKYKVNNIKDLTEVEAGLTMGFYL